MAASLPKLLAREFHRLRRLVEFPSLNESEVEATYRLKVLSKCADSGFPTYRDDTYIHTCILCLPNGAFQEQ